MLLQQLVTGRELGRRLERKKIESHLRLLCMIPNLIWVGEMGMLVGDSLSGHLLTGVITKRASGLAIALKQFLV
jgi:hypothetical protein